MWTREADGSVIDEATGKIIFFSEERFVQDICLGDCCFICGAKRASVPFNDEHVLADWILRRYSLHDRSITLPNLTGFRYGGYVIPCCESCNSRMGNVFEKPIS